MKQRVVMVLSTLLDPSLLIADEVTSALDVSTQRAVAEMLVEFRDREFVKSMIVITHDLSVLYQIADTILVMYAGQAGREGAPPRRSSTRPRHPYTKLLLSSLPEVGVRYAEKQLSGIPGRPPPLLDPPTGCRFKDRCPLAFAKCAGGAAVRRDRAGHSSACCAARRPRPPDAASSTRVGRPTRRARSAGELAAVCDVSFGVAPGEVVSLIGESGSGKTTIGKMILRLLRTTAGAITFDGRDIAASRGRN